MSFYDAQGNLRKDLTEAEFAQWKEAWLREKGCPFFACSQALYRKVCGNTLICGSLFTYDMYKTKPWIKVCDIALEENITLPTKGCAACTGSMCLKFEDAHNMLIGKSFCKYINDLYEERGITVDRSLEKYIASWGAFLIPVIGEEMFLHVQSNPDLIDKLQKEAEQFQNEKNM